MAGTTEVHLIDTVVDKLLPLAKELFAHPDDYGNYKLYVGGKKTVDLIQLLYIMLVNFDPNCRKDKHWACHAKLCMGYEIDLISERDITSDKPMPDSLKISHIWIQRVWCADFEQAKKELMNCIANIEYTLKSLIEMLKVDWMFVRDVKTSGVFTPTSYWSNVGISTGYYLLANDSRLYDEARLIELLAKQFGISGMVSHDDNINQMSKHKVCILVREEKFNELVTHFSLRDRCGNLLSVIS
jgi:hypothetical protein